MNTVELQIPDGYELKEVDKGKWQLVQKEVKLEQLLTVTTPAVIATPFGERNINFRTVDQLDRVEAMLKLMCVADYLNNGWQPDWNDKEEKWHIEWYEYDMNKLIVDWSCTYSTCGEVVFKTQELAEKAIEICGVELIKKALGV